MTYEPICFRQFVDDIIKTKRACYTVVGTLYGQDLLTLVIKLNSAAVGIHYTNSK